MWRSLGMILGFVAISAAYAVEPGEQLADPAMEARARAISAELRCLVCQNQSIDDSNAPLAHDLRVLVRERLLTGSSDVEVLQFVVARYGEYVLLRPRFGWHTALLWLAPATLLAWVAFALRNRWRQQSVAASDQPLSEDEKRRLERLLRDGPPAA